MARTSKMQKRLIQAGINKRIVYGDNAPTKRERDDVLRSYAPLPRQMRAALSEYYKRQRRDAGVVQSIWATVKLLWRMVRPC